MDGAQDGQNSGGGGGDDGLELPPAFLERPDTLRSMTSLDADEAKTLYRQVLSKITTPQSPRRAGRGGRAKRAGGARAGAPMAPPTFDMFLMAVMLVRKRDEVFVDFTFKAPSGTARAALDELVPVLLECHGVPRRFARWLAPLKNGDIRDYMGRSGRRAGGRTPS